MTRSRARIAIAAAAAAVLAMVAAPAPVRGEPSPGRRVVLADPDPELRHAMEQALAPYRLAIVIEGPAPADASLAQQRADADTARFVVWRDGSELVVYDRELGTTERRGSQAGPLDPPAAAAAALTIKTMMRLPPPPPPEPIAAPAPPLAPAPSGGIELRLQAQIATRIARGDQTAATARFAGAVAIRPWPSAGLRLGVAGDTGSATDVDQASFKGTWSEWAALGFLSWTWAPSALEIEPHVGFGVRSSRLDGLEMSAPRAESATLMTARGGVWARWRYARWTIGGTLDVDEVFGTPTYIKGTGQATVFQVPGGAIELGAVLAVDL